METRPVSVAVHIIGLVQGVGFRAWVVAQASDLGLNGTVANEADGSVRATLTGPDEAVTLMLDRLRQGPPLARVDTLVTTPADPADSHSGFHVTD